MLLLLAVSASGAAFADDGADVLAAAPACVATRCLDVRLHVVTGAATPTWIAEQLRFANEKFAPVDVGFRVVQVEMLATPEHIHTRADRDAIAHGRLDARTIDVFFAARIDNIDVAGDRIYGVTWRSKDGRYILVSGEAQPRTLTHELGHLFGLSHTTEPTSLMTSSPSPDVPAEARVFLEAEITRMKPTITRRVEGQRR